MNHMIRGLAIAVLAYDEANCEKKLRSRFDIRFFDKWMTKTDFFFVAIIGDTMEIGIRGTDGTDLKKWLSAWKRNFTVATTDHGYPKGFYDSAKTIFDMMTSGNPNLLYDYSIKHINVRGHSAGGAIAPIVAMLLSERTGRYIDSLTFAAAPFGNQEALQRYNGMHDADMIHNTYVINPGDPMTFMFRDHISPATDGFDPGTPFRLPESGPAQKVFRFIPIARVFEHSPREYCKGLMVHFKGNKEAIDDLKWVKKQLVN